MCIGSEFGPNNTGTKAIIGLTFEACQHKSCFWPRRIELLTVPAPTAIRPCLGLKRSPIAFRSIAFCIVLLAPLLLVPAFAPAATKLRFDEPTGMLRIQVDPDAPPVIELRSDDLLPIRWERGSVTDALLPALAVRPVTDLAIVDDQSVAYALPIRVQLSQIAFDPQRYMQVANWHGQPDAAQRRRIVLLAVLFSLGLLLTLLVRRRAQAWGLVYCSAWALGIFIEARNEPSLVWKDLPTEPPARVCFARSPQTLRLTAGEDVPIVESTQHLQAIRLRVEVHGTEARLLADLPEWGKLIVSKVAR